MVPGRPPRPEGRSKISQSSEGEQIRRQWNEHSVSSKQSRSIDCAEIRADIDEYDIGSDPSSGDLNNPVERRCRPQRCRVSSEALGPGFAQPILESAQRQVTSKQPEPIRDLFRLTRTNVPHAFHNRPDGGGNCGSAVSLAPPGRPRRLVGLPPDQLEFLFIKKGHRQVRLGIQVHGKNILAEPLEHVREVIGEGRLPYTTLVIEQRHRDHVALLRVTVHEASSTMNSGSGLPFRLNDARIRPIPRPNWLT